MAILFQIVLLSYYVTIQVFFLFAASGGREGGLAGTPRTPPRGQLAPWSPYRIITHLILMSKTGNVGNLCISKVAYLEVRSYASPLSFVLMKGFSTSSDVSGL